MQDDGKSERTAYQVMGLKEKQEKPWDELRDSEKIDRMREAIKSLQHENGRLHNRVYVLEHKLNLHQHIDKSIVVPLESVDSLTRSFDYSAKDAIHTASWF